MMSRRLLVSMLVAAALSLVGLPAFADSTTKLFFIQRSKNANEVHYDARVTSAGTLDAKTPVDGYWIRKAEDGGRSSIKWYQRIAYGYDVEPAAGGTYTMKLKAFPERPLVLVQAGGRWRARTTIAGHTAYLSRLYVATDESGIFPKVLYVDVFGEDLTTGKPVQERIVKK